MRLHDLKTLVDTAEVKIDYCTECKEKFIYRKDKEGRIDNKQYLKDHMRNYLQRDDPLFKRYNDKPFDFEEDRAFADQQFKQQMAQVERNKFNNK